MGTALVKVAKRFHIIFTGTILFLYFILRIKSRFNKGGGLFCHQLVGGRILDLDQDQNLDLPEWGWGVGVCVEGIRKPTLTGVTYLPGTVLGACTHGSVRLSTLSLCWREVSCFYR